MKLFKIFILSMILEQVIFLADYYTDLVSSFRFVVIKEILGFFLRPTGCLEEFSFLIVQVCTRLRLISYM